LANGWATMNKVKEFFVENIKRAIWSVVVLVLGYLATLGYWFCKILGVNAIYCDQPFVQYEFFLIFGGLLSVCAAFISKNWGWRWPSLVLFCAAVLIAFIVVIISHLYLASFPRAPEEFIEFSLVVPLQVAFGVIIGQVLIWIWNWNQLEVVVREWLRKLLGLTSATTEAEKTGPS
jgi:hypothetical protein